MVEEENEPTNAIDEASENDENKEEEEEEENPLNSLFEEESSEIDTSEQKSEEKEEKQAKLDEDQIPDEDTAPDDLTSESGEESSEEETLKDTTESESTESSKESEESTSESVDDEMDNLFEDEESEEESGNIASESGVETTPQETQTRTSTTSDVIDTSKGDFDLLPDTEQGKATIVCYSHKGHGKTDAALSINGSIGALSFDNRTKPVAEKRYSERLINSFSSVDELMKQVKEKPNWILVWDAMKYYNGSTPQAKLTSSETTYNYLLEVLDFMGKNMKPDWILFDGVELSMEIFEMLMRLRNGIQPFEGFKNLNLWKERRMYLRHVHEAAARNAKRGVIYTLYPKNYDIEIENGEVVNRHEMPGWIDVILTETDTVIKIEQKFTDGKSRRIAVVESNKSPILDLKEGKRVDISGDYAFGVLNKSA